MSTSKVKILLQGQDDLTPQLKQCEASLQTLTSKADKLDKIQKDFDKITSSTRPLRQQLKQLQTIMADMNLNGLDNTPLFTEMAQHAGSLADAMGDARTAVNAFADDNFKLKAMTEGLTLVASAGSIATGAMGLFGTENEKVTQAILKVQSALAILNGVQAVANSLNKDSALMLRLKQIRMVASTKTTVADSVATSANSVSMLANTVATTLAQKAREKLNYTLAVGKALMGDWTGLLLVGAAALTTYAIATSDSTDKTDKNNAKLKEAESTYSKYQAELGRATANITSKMTVLKTQWGLLRSEAEKTQWIKDNKSAFDEMGISINNVYEAEELFVKHTDAVVNAMIARAKAQASANKLTNDEIERDDKIREVNKKYDSYIDDKMPVQKGQTITVKKANELGINSDNSKIYHEVSSQDIATLNKRYSEEGERLRQQEIDSINAHYDHIKKENTDLVRESAEAVIDAEDEVSKYFKKSSNNTKTNPKNNKKNEVVDKDSVKYAEEQLKKFQEARVKIPIDATDKLKENEDKIKFWEKEVEKRKVAIKIETEYEDNLKGLQQKLKDLEEEKIKINPNDEERIKTVNESIEKTKKDIEATEIKLGIKPNIEEGSINKIEKEISDVIKQIGNIDPKTNPQKYQELIDKLVSLKKAQKEYNDEFERMTDIQEKASIYFEPNKLVKGNDEDKSQSYDNAMAQINNIGDKVAKNIMSKEEAQSQIDDIVKQLQETIPDLEIKVKVKEDGSIETIKKSSITAEEALGNIGSAVNSLGASMQNLSNDNEALAKSAAVVQAIGTLVMSFAQSMKGSVTVWDWIAGAVAGVATLTSVIAQMQSFEQGGIVQGSSYIGDRTLVRANAGEMILNRSQQDNLYNAIKNNDLGSNNIGGNVTFRIDGTTLKGVLNNTNRKIAKQS